MTIYRRDDKQCVSVYDPVTQQMRWVGTFATEDEARKAEQDALAAIMSCDGYADRWLDIHPRRSAETNRTYQRTARRFAERFAGVPLGKLDYSALFTWIAGQPLGNREAVRVMLSDAISDGIVPGPNPLSYDPLLRHRPEPPSPLSRDGLFRLAECAIDVWGDYGLNVLAPLLITTAYLRLSSAEVVALRRDDVGDADIFIQRTHPKRLPLPHEVRMAIDGVPDNDTPWLFTSKTGRQLTSGRIWYHWTPVRAVFGQLDLQFEDLRFFRPDET